MSRTQPTEWEEMVLAIACTYCDSPPGEWCGTRTGYWSTWLHAAREHPIQVAYQRGKAMGRQIERDLARGAARRDAEATRAAG